MPFAINIRFQNRITIYVNFLCYANYFNISYKKSKRSFRVKKSKAKYPA